MKFFLADLKLMDIRVLSKELPGYVRMDGTSMTSAFATNDNLRSNEPQSYQIS